MKIPKLVPNVSAEDSKKVLVTNPIMHHWYGLAEMARARIVTGEATKVLHDSGNVLDDGLSTITDSYALGRWLDGIRSDVTGLMISIINQFIELKPVEQ